MPSPQPDRGLLFTLVVTYMYVLDVRLFLHLVPASATVTPIQGISGQPYQPGSVNHSKSCHLSLHSLLPYAIHPARLSKERKREQCRELYFCQNESVGQIPEWVSKQRYSGTALCKELIHCFAERLVRHNNADYKTVAIEST
jgi:hypothetical protein